MHLIETASHALAAFRFGHALIRETLYDEMLGLRRSRLAPAHRRAARTAATVGDDAAMLPQLAYHFSEAGPGAAAKALDYARRSAERGRASAGLRGSGAPVPPGAAPAAAPLRDGLRRSAASCCSAWARRSCRSAPASRPARSTPQAGRTGAQRTAWRNCSRERDRLRARRDAGRPSRANRPWRCCWRRSRCTKATTRCASSCFARLCRAYVYCDRADEARQAHRRAVALARQLDDSDSLCVALASIVSANYWPTCWRERLAAAERGLGHRRRATA